MFAEPGRVGASRLPLVIYTVLVVSSVEIGCTVPFQAYPGPRLPRTETALFTKHIGLLVGVATHQLPEDIRSLLKVYEPLGRSLYEWNYYFWTLDGAPIGQEQKAVAARGGRNLTPTFEIEVLPGTYVLVVLSYIEISRIKSWGRGDTVTFYKYKHKPITLTAKRGHSYVFMSLPNRGVAHGDLGPFKVPKIVVIELKPPSAGTWTPGVEASVAAREGD